MGRIDDLIEHVPDPALREELQRAVGALKREQRFGLVFEEHIPETTTLIGIPVRVGSLVQRRDVLEGGAIYRVASIARNVAEVEPTDERAQPRSGERERIPVRDLLVLKRFGEPVYPALRSLGGISRGGESKPHHAVINGENFHALQLLVYLLEGRVDCIYIDPPYNTGARDWKYNNRYVDSNDTWRHSKWLSMMHKRLKLAKRLLKSDGVLIVTVDEHEAFHLGSLLERADLFPEPDFLRQTVTIVINPKGTAKTNLARVEEYAIFVMPSIGRNVISDRPALEPKARAPRSDFAQFAMDLEPLRDEESDDEEMEERIEAAEDEDPEDAAATPDARRNWEWRHARRRGAESSYRPARPNQFYPIYVDEKTQRVVKAGPSIPLAAKPSFRPVDGLLPIWPIDKNGDDRCWAFKPESMQLRIDAGLVRARYREKQGTWTLNYAVPRKTTRKWKTVWTDSAYDAGTHGTELLRKLLGKPRLFPFPKSVYAVRDCLATVVANRPNAIVLDFFAGSGTTLHSTALLNAADGGHRQCILVTNNEVEESVARQLYRDGTYRGDPEFERHGIFQQVTRPRCEAVVRGTRADGTPLPKQLAGFLENIEFFQLDYIDPDELDLRHSDAALIPLLWLSAGAVGPRDAQADCPFSMPRGSRYGVLFEEKRFRAFSEELRHRSDVTHVWLVTDSEAAFGEMRARLPSHVRASMLYQDYLRNFRLNVEQFA